MEKETRRELLDTIDSQKEQLKRYESRLRDVVRAYKGLVTEKEALEASLKVLTPVQGSGPSTAPTPTGLTSTHLLDKNQHSGNVEDVERLREQIQTLSSSLATLTQEKSRLEGSFIADKKKLIIENEELQKSLEVETAQRLSERMELQTQIAEVKGYLRSQQLEREAEQTNHGIMLKELQLLLSEERAAKEQIENKLECLQLTSKEDSRSTRDEEYDKQILVLSQELDAARKLLKKESVKSEVSSAPVLFELQKEMEKMKKNYQVQVSEEAQRANDAEMRLSVCAKQSEERICCLETKLSEISTIMGNYDKLRLKDQDVITRLKERVSQLDNENAALSTAVGSNTTSSAAAAAATAADNTMDTKYLADKLLYFHDLLLAANEKSDCPIDVANLLKGIEKSDSHHLHCAQYKQQLENLREEYERYKLRAQSVLKTKSKDSSNKEVEVLKEQVTQLRERIRQLHQEHSDEVESNKRKIEHLNKNLHSQEEKHKQTEAHLKSQHAKQIKEIEQQLRKQRERTITMLSEKEKEINTLKNSTGQDLEVEYLKEMRGSVQVDTASSETFELEHSNSLSQLFVEPTGSQGETLLLHFAQEQARRDVEIAALRKQRRQAETALRDLQHSSSLKQEALLDENEKLKEEIWKQQRNYRRENANLEYLKNVILNFLTSYDRQGKKQMLKAIMTILQFSPKEIDKVNKCSTNI